MPATPSLHHRLLAALTGVWLRLRQNPDGDGSEGGASLVEYALLVALIAVVVIVSIVFFGGALQGKYSQYGSAVGAAGS